MTPRRPIPQSVRGRVRRRANQLCEYCHTSERWQYTLFTVDHVVPIARGGTDSFDNLALACSYCNRQKGQQVSDIDPQSQVEVALYNPREASWAEHFCWSADRLHVVGIIPTGRATVQALDMNRSRVTRLRLQDLAIDRHPPAGDPVQQAEEE